MLLRHDTVKTLYYPKSWKMVMHATVTQAVCQPTNFMYQNMIDQVKHDISFKDAHELLHHIVVQVY